jgi:N-terminal acetyltransferase B complex non-catalytic subunit
MSHPHKSLRNDQYPSSITTNLENTDFLLQVAVCLESGLLKSKDSVQFKLLLIRTYLLLGTPPSPHLTTGAARLAAQIWSSLNIKQIQHDTLSYIFLTRISSITRVHNLDHMLPLAQSIYLSAKEEVPPQVVQAFERGAYHNVPEFWELGDRLERSVSRILMNEEGELDRVRTEHQVPLEEELIDCMDICD